MNVKLPNGWKKWDNSPIVLFHGTVETAAKAVLAGVDVLQGFPFTDFGRGFYTTTLQSQALRWAMDKPSSDLEDRPVVVKLTLDRSALGKLGHLGFVRGAQDATDYWRFVFHCRAGKPHRKGSESYYDVVYGPVAQIWRDPPLRQVWFDFDQIGFHTSAAQDLLNDPSLCHKEIL